MIRSSPYDYPTLKRVVTKKMAIRDPPPSHHTPYINRLAQWDCEIICNSPPPLTYYSHAKHMCTSLCAHRHCRWPRVEQSQLDFSLALGTLPEVPAPYVPSQRLEDNLRNGRGRRKSKLMLVWPLEEPEKLHEHHLHACKSTNMRCQILQAQLDACHIQSLVRSGLIKSRRSKVAKRVIQSHSRTGQHISADTIRYDSEP